MVLPPSGGRLQEGVACPGEGGSRALRMTLFRTCPERPRRPAVLSQRAPPPGRSRTIQTMTTLNELLNMTSMLERSQGRVDIGPMHVIILIHCAFTVPQGAGMRTSSRNTIGSEVLCSSSSCPHPFRCQIVPVVPLRKKNVRGNGTVEEAPDPAGTYSARGTLSLAVNCDFALYLPSRIAIYARNGDILSRSQM